MSAAIFGANLLEEVKEESLDQLLSDLRYAVEPEPKRLLGIPKIDGLLHNVYSADSTLHNARTQHQDQSRDITEDDVANDPFETYTTDPFIRTATKYTPPMIEISKVTSSTCDLDLLCLLTAASILPRDHGGKEATVVWLDTDISFSATRLHDICLNFVRNTSLTAHPSEQASTVEEGMRHVHVFSISSSKQLISVLDSLEDYLLQPHVKAHTKNLHSSAHRPLSLLVLDSATAFYWTDRFDAEIARLEAITIPGATAPGPTAPQSTSITTASQILTKLKALQTKFDCTCVYTTTQPQKPRPPRARQSSDVYSTPTRPQMDETPSLSPWTLAATMSLTLMRVPVPQFASHMSLDECLRDRAKRQEVVGLNRIRVGVSEEWLGAVVRDREVRDRLNRLEGKGAFVFRLDGIGVRIE